MNRPSFPSSEIYFHFKKFQSFLFLFLFFIIFTSIQSSSSFSSQTISYVDHCASVVPEAVPTDMVFTRYPFLEPVTSHYTGGQKILGESSSSQSQRSLLFAATPNLFKTNIIDTYKIQARLTFHSSNIYGPSNLTYYVNGRRSNYSRMAARYRRRPLVFFLDGFWSISSKKLCMVGSARWYSKEGNPLKLEAVLKLNFARNITVTTSLVSGILESLASPDDSNYFESISILGVPRVASFKYNYTLVSDEECEGGVDTRKASSSLSMMNSLDPCSIFTNRFMTYQMQYPGNCTQNCMPFGRRSGYLPSFVSLYAIQCSYIDKKLRFLIEFQDRRYTPYDQSFNPNITLIGEGTWNGTGDHMCIVACQILDQNDPLGSAHIGDCSIRLTLWYPAVRSIRNTHNVEGQIWTTKTADDIGYFETVKIQSFDHSLEKYGLKYEFTQMEKVRRFCPWKKLAKRKGHTYPEGYYQDMMFDISVNNKNMASTGFAYPIFVGDRFYRSYQTMVSNSSQWQEAPAAVSTSTTDYTGPLNVSYEISFRPYNRSIATGGFSSLNLSSSHNGRVKMSAEGIYDSETGHLCMIGCRNLHSYDKNSINDNMDCEILVKFQLPRVNSQNGGLVKGSIESLREKRDVLYFDRLHISSLTYTESVARNAIWRIDLEIVMVLVSDTLTCVFIALQLFHVRRHPEMVPFISVLMMVILTFGHMVPLVLNFEAMFLTTRNRTNVALGSGWLEVNEVAVRIVTMVAFLLQFRLLQLTWKGKNNWDPETKTLLISLPMYILGVLAALLVNVMNDNYNDGQSQRSIWGDLRSYAGLTLDGFLFPQLILNIFQISKGIALSHSFYIGISIVRLLPHAYDLYRGPTNISHQFDKFYIYANPGADFYSASWDIVIFSAGIVFVVIIFLQQHFGGRFMFPKRFREANEYEMVTVTSNE